jgi:hypothetical protein
VETEDETEMRQLFDEMKSDPAVNQEARSHPEIVTALENLGLLEKKSVEADAESERARARADADTGGWMAAPQRTKAEKLAFLGEVVRRARSIIPAAFNRAVEVPAGGGATVQDGAYHCREVLISEYVRDLQRAGVNTRNRYVHPAALERMIGIIHATKPVELGELQMAGVCKDFASLCYGLILQNDTRGEYKPRLSMMKGHVFVEVRVGQEIYAVDAWIAHDAAAPVLLLSQHAAQMKELHGSIKPAEAEHLAGTHPPVRTLTVPCPPSKIAVRASVSADPRGGCEDGQTDGGR